MASPTQCCRLTSEKVLCACPDLVVIEQVTPSGGETFTLRA